MKKLLSAALKLSMTPDAAACGGGTSGGTKLAVFAVSSVSSPPVQEDL